MASDNEGLDLFDETASAVGSFPTAAWGGYNKSSVDEYLRTLEGQIADLKRVQRDLRRKLDRQRAELDKPAQMDFTNLGAHTTQILSTAEAQAREITDRANSQAEQYLAEVRQQAAEVRNAAEQDADDLRTTTLAEARALRERWDAETREIIAASRAEADGLVASARQHADSVTAQADAHAAMVRTGAEVEARTIVADAERTATEARDVAASQAAATVSKAEEDARALLDAARTEARTTLEEAQEKARLLLAEAHDEAARVRDEAVATATGLRADVDEEVRLTRQKVAEERDATLATLRQEMETVRQETARLLDDARARHEALVTAIAEDSERAQKLRSDALAEAEQTKVLAAREGQQLVQQAQKEAEAAHQRVADRWAERQSRLRRETDMLTQRKHAIVAQLSNLSALAGTSAEDFPDMEFGALDELTRDPVIDPPFDHEEPEVVDEATVVLDRESADRLEAERVRDEDTRQQSAVGSSDRAEQ